MGYILNTYMSMSRKHKTIKTIQCCCQMHYFAGGISQCYSQANWNFNINFLSEIAINV